MLSLSHRILGVDPSGTTRLFALVEQLRSQGRELISFAVGDPFFQTPSNIIQATQKALDQGKTRYSAVSGLAELKTELAKQYEGLSADHILISNGAKQCLFTLFQVICNPGDEVILPRPCWTSFPQQIKLAGAAPMLVDTLNNDQLDLAAIEEAITPKTKAILVNSPNNPTGAVYPLSDLAALCALAEEKDFMVISDEAYAGFTYDGLNDCSLFDSASHRHRMVIVRSFSKRYSMTGFRVGYVVASPELINAMDRFQSHSSGNVCTFAQWGALAALSVNRDLLAEQRAALESNRNLAMDAISEIFPCTPPGGAFYLFPDVSGYLKPGETSEDFAAYLLEAAGVAVVPGEVFETAGHIRICYAIDEAHLKNGLDRIKAVL